MTNTLANIFGSSPVRPLEKHIDAACKCVKQLDALVVAAVAGDWAHAAEIQARIDQFEDKADDLKLEIRLNLRRSLLMPVAKEDLLRLLKVQDALANRSRDAARVLVGRRMRIPGSVAERFQTFVRLNVDAAKLARKSVRELDELFTVGFRGAEVDLVSGYIEQIEAIHAEADLCQSALCSELVAIEETLNPVDAVFMYQVVEKIWGIADAAEDIGQCLEMLISH